MKKFYLHNGKEQTGPFDVEELKSKNINKDTPVWYEGLSDWTTAEKIDDLKEILKTTTPPPFGEKINTPPPISNKNQQTITNTPLKKKKNYSRIIIGLVIIILVGGGLVVFMNNPNSVPAIKLEINTPKPIVVTSRADDDKSGLFNARTTVYATVMNQGGDGNVIVTFYVYQGSKKYDISKTIYLSAGQSQDLEVTFEEVDYLSGEVTYNVEVSA